MTSERDLQLLERLEGIGDLTQSCALEIVNEVYRDGLVSRSEASTLFYLHGRLTPDDSSWDDRFIEAITDFILTAGEPKGWIDAEHAEWLVNKVSENGELVGETEIELLVNVCRKASGVPLVLSRAALQAVSDRIIALGKADARGTEQMRAILHAPGGEDGIWVNRHEANTLLKTNDAIGFAENDPAWNDLFSRAIANHLLAAAHPSPQSHADALHRDRWLKETHRSLGRILSPVLTPFGSGDWFARVTSNSASASRARNTAVAAANRVGRDVTAEENHWFLKRLGWKGDRNDTISPAEQALVSFLQQEIPGFADGLTVAA